MGFKVYAMAMYVEDAGARAAFPSLRRRRGARIDDSLLHSDLAYKFVVLGEFGKAAIPLRPRGLGGRHPQSLSRGAAGDEQWRRPSDLQRDIEAVRGAVRRRRGRRRRADCSTPKARSSSRRTVKTARPDQPATVARHLGAVAGAKPISSDLKKTILDRVDTLGR